MPAGLRLLRPDDPDVFRRLVVAHQARVFSLALRITGRRADAEELAQDAFLQLHASPVRFDSEAHLKHWLLRAVAHRAIDLLRRREREGLQMPLDQLDRAPQMQVSAQHGDPLASAQLTRLLLQLAPDARAVLLLRFQEDLDPADIAAVLAMPLNTVKSHLRRSLDYLRAQFPGEHHGS